MSKIIKTLAFCALLPLFFASCNNPENSVEWVGYSSLEDLEDQTVGVIAGSTSDILISDTNNFANVKVERFDIPADLIKAVELGTVDCGVTDSVVLMAQALSKHGLSVDFTLPGGFDVAAAFNKKNVELCSQFNDFLFQIKSDGTLDGMLARWSSDKVDTLAMPALPDLEALQGHPLEVALLKGNAPFSYYKRNVWTGLEVELMLRFAIYIGRPVHFSGYAFEDIIPELNNNTVDIAAGNMFITPERADQVIFSNPYYFCKTCCFSKNN